MTRCVSCGTWDATEHHWPDGLVYVGSRCRTCARPAAEAAAARDANHRAQLARYADATGIEAARAYLAFLNDPNAEPLSDPRWQGWHAHADAFHAWSHANPLRTPARPVSRPASPPQPPPPQTAAPLQRRQRLTRPTTKEK